MKTYALDFIKKLPRKQNVPIIIYFLVNMAIMFFVNFILFDEMLSIRNISDGVTLVIAIAASIIIYSIGVVIALSPVGEWLLRKKEKCKKIEELENNDRVVNLFNEVYQAAKENNPEIPDDVKLFYTENEEINAFAVGRKSVAITKGLLTLPDDQIKGIIGHEFGHIKNHDTDLSLVVNVANWFVTAYFLAVRLIIEFYRLLAKGLVVISFFASQTLGEFISTIFIKKAFDFMLWFFVTVFSALWTAFGNLLIKSSTRSNEMLADKYSKELGYGDSLADFLGTITTGRNNLSFFKRLSAVLADTHPTPEKRISELRK